MYPGPYGAPPVPRPSSAGQVRPSKLWFLAAAGVAVVGIVASILIAVVTALSYTDRIDHFDRVSVPGTMRVDLDRGGWSIYHEFRGADNVDNFGDPVDNPAFRLAPKVTVTGPSGEAVRLTSYDSTVSYAAGRHEGQGIYTFRATEAGTYVVTAEGEGVLGGSAIAVGPGIGSGLAVGIVGALLVGGGGVVAGAVVAIVIGVRRVHNRRNLTPPPYGGYPGPGWPAPAPPGTGYPGAAGFPQPQPPYPGAPPAGPPSWGPPPPAPPPPPGPPSHPAARGAVAPGPAGSPGRPAWAPAAISRPRAAPGGVDATVDPPSLRGPVDWSQGEVPLGWSRRD